MNSNLCIGDLCVADACNIWNDSIPESLMDQVGYGDLVVLLDVHHTSELLNYKVLTPRGVVGWIQSSPSRVDRIRRVE